MLWKAHRRTIRWCDWRQRILENRATEWKALGNPWVFGYTDSDSQSITQASIHFLACYDRGGDVVKGLRHLSVKCVEKTKKRYSTWYFPGDGRERKARNSGWESYISNWLECNTVASFSTTNIVFNAIAAENETNADQKKKCHTMSQLKSTREMPAPT